LHLTAKKGISLPEYFQGLKFNFITTTGILNNKALENICNQMTT